MSTATLDELLRLVGLHMGKRNVRASDRLVEDLGAESVDVANIVAAVEEKYRIQIRESEIARIRTAADLLALVQERG